MKKLCVVIRTDQAFQISEDKLTIKHLLEIIDNRYIVISSSPDIVNYKMCMVVVYITISV